MQALLPSLKKDFTEIQQHMAAAAAESSEGVTPSDSGQTSGVNRQHNQEMRTVVSSFNTRIVGTSLKTESNWKEFAGKIAAKQEEFDGPPSTSTAAKSSTLDPALTKFVNTAQEYKEAVTRHENHSKGIDLPPPERTLTPNQVESHNKKAVANAKEAMDIKLGLFKEGFKTFQLIDQISTKTAAFTSKLNETGHSKDEYAKFGEELKELDGKLGAKRSELEPKLAKTVDLAKDIAQKLDAFNGHMQLAPLAGGLLDENIKSLDQEIKAKIKELNQHLRGVESNPQSISQNASGPLNLSSINPRLAGSMSTSRGSRSLSESDSSYPSNLSSSNSGPEGRMSGSISPRPGSLDNDALIARSRQDSLIASRQSLILPSGHEQRPDISQPLPMDGTLAAGAFEQVQNVFSQLGNINDLISQLPDQPPNEYWASFSRQIDSRKEPISSMKESVVLDQDTTTLLDTAAEYAQCLGLIEDLEDELGPNFETDLKADPKLTQAHSSQVKNSERLLNILQETLKNIKNSSDAAPAAPADDTSTTTPSPNRPRRKSPPPRRRSSVEDAETAREGSIMSSSPAANPVAALAPQRGSIIEETTRPPVSNETLNTNMNRFISVIPSKPTALGWETFSKEISQEMETLEEQDGELSLGSEKKAELANTAHDYAKCLTAIEESSGNIPMQTQLSATGNKLLEKLNTLHADVQSETSTQALPVGSNLGVSSRRAAEGAVKTAPPKNTARPVASTVRGGDGMRDSPDALKLHPRVNEAADSLESTLKAEIDAKFKAIISSTKSEASGTRELRQYLSELGQIKPSASEDEKKVAVKKQLYLCQKLLATTFKITDMRMAFLVDKLDGVNI